MGTWVENKGDAFCLHLRTRWLFLSSPRSFILLPLIDKRPLQLMDRSATNRSRYIEVQQRESPPRGDCTFSTFPLRPQWTPTQEFALELSIGIAQKGKTVFQPRSAPVHNSLPCRIHREKRFPLKQIYKKIGTSQGKINPML